MINTITNFSHDVVKMFEQPKMLTAVSVASSIGSTIASGAGMYMAMKDIEKTGATGFKAFTEGAASQVPAVLLEGVAVATNIKSTSIAETNAMHWAGAYTMMAQQYLLYKKSTEDALKKEFTPKKLEKFEAKRTEAMANRIGQFHKKEIIDTGEGDQLFYDVLSKRPFWSSYEAIATHLANLDRKLNNDPYCSWVTVNEYFYEIGLEGIAFGDEHGWTNALVNKFPMGSPNPEWTWVDGRRVTCGFLQFEDQPVHEETRRLYRM
jgi:hypothetical protein